MENLDRNMAMNFSIRLTTAMLDRGVSIQNISDAIGVTYEMVRRYKHGKAIPRPETLHKIAEYLNYSPSWLQFGTEPKYLRARETSRVESNVGEIGRFDLWDKNTPINDDEVAVPFYKDIRLAAGNGFADDIEDYNAFNLRFSKATLRRAGVQFNQAVCLTAKGNSMEPVLPDGTTVGINLGNKEIKDGKMYAINHGGLLRIKVLYSLPNNFVRIRSYNSDEHPDEEAKLEEINILGQVFWWSFLDH